jgi:uncharacterized YigZ family protein
VSTAARYPILAAQCRVEQTIDRSRFLATLRPVSSVEEAQELTESLRREFPAATHHCWAYLVGAPGSTAQVGMSDDGEPHGTAGRPMLDVLLHCGLGDLAAVVTRWYGGTKLGKGGLVRAYGGTVGLGLAGAPTSLRTQWTQLTLGMSYSQVSAVQHRYGAFEVELLDETFAAAVTHEVRLPQEHRAAFEVAVMDATSGTIALHCPADDDAANDADNA